MDVLLQILLSLVSLICLFGGLNVLLKGVKSFLPDIIGPQPLLDNLFRFLCGIYLGLGFLTAWVVFNFQETTDLIYFIGLIVVFSGLGRLYSKFKVGSAGGYYENIMLFEIILGIVIMLLEYLR